MTAEPSRAAPTFVERLLRIFTDVRAGEGPTALVLFANVFLILCAYYLVKPLREGWIAISDVQGLSKTAVKAYTAFFQSLLLVPVVAVYAHLVNRLPRTRLISYATLFCMSNLVVFWFLQPDFLIRHLPGAGIAFYLWVGMFGVFVVAQFWAFVADLYDGDRGDRLMPLIAIGATAGGVFGAWISEVLVRQDELVRKSLLLIALVPLAVSVMLTRWADRRGPDGSGSPPAQSPAAGGDGNGKGALAVVFRSRYLLGVALVTLIMFWVNTNGENLLYRLLQDSIASNVSAQGITDDAAIRELTRTETTAFYGSFYRWVNGLALFLQALVASRLLRFGGFGAIFLAMPVVALLGYSVMAVLPILAIVTAMKVPENATNYSISNTARHVLWLPLTAEEKFKGKPAIDTVFVRVGDGMAALTVMIGVEAMALSTRTLAGMNVGLVLIWLALGMLVVREHRRVRPPQKRAVRVEAAVGAT